MITNQRMLFPEPTITIHGDQYLGGREGTEGARLPWIHNKDVPGLYFHSKNVLS